MDPGEPAVAKDELREGLLFRRRARPTAQRVAAADAVASALLAGLDGVGTLAAFVPDPSEPGCGRLPAATGPSPSSSSSPATLRAWASPE